MSIPRVVMSIAIAVLDEGSGHWARAMSIEFDEAERDRNAFGFAVGCLIASLRLLASTSNGRNCLARYALALGVVLPFAAFHLGCSTNGLRYLLTGYDPYLIELEAGGAQKHPIAQTYAALAPLLTFLLAALGSGHLLIAWRVVAGEWRGTASAMGWTAMVAAALSLCIWAIHPTPEGLVLQCAALALEAAVIPMLARRQLRAVEPTRSDRKPESDLSHDDRWV